jgi:membrane associated rhomboid family serine protease
MPNTIGPLQVLRGHRIVVEGTLDLLVAAGHQGKILPFDRVVGLRPEALQPNQVPELAAVVPTSDEYYLRRGLRAVAAFNAFFALIIAALALIFVTHDPTFRDWLQLLRLIVLAVAIFGVPMFLMRAALRRAVTLRLAGGGAVEHAGGQGASAGGYGTPLSAFALPKADDLLMKHFPATRALLLAISGVELLSLLGARATIIEHAAKLNERIWAGELWRLLTAVFIHANFTHFLLNTACVLVLGRALERTQGSRRTLLLFTLGGLGGTLASLAFTPAASVGASGAVFAMIAAVLVDGARARLARPGADWAPFVVVCLCFACVAGIAALLVPKLDAPAHAGGLIAGLLSGLLMPRRGSKESSPFVQSGERASP